jgi:hypothetical protein
MHIITYTTKQKRINRRITFDANQIGAVLSLIRQLREQGLEYVHMFEE